MQVKQSSARSPAPDADLARSAARSPATRRQYLVSGIVLAAFVVLVEWYLGWSTLLAPWALVPPALALAGLGMVLASYLVRALRFYFYFGVEMRGRLRDCIKLTAYHNFFNYLLPMRSGEIAFPILMARYFHIGITRSVPVLVWFRLLDLHTLVLLAIFSLPLVNIPLSAVYALAASWLTIPWLIYRFHRYIGDRLEHPDDSRWRAALVDALASLPSDSRAFLVAWTWTLVNWSVKLTVIVVGLGIFVGTETRTALAAAVAGELSMVLPIHNVAATGTYEAAIAGVLVPAGMPFDKALAGAINVHLYMILGVLITGMIGIVIPTPAQSKQERST